MQCVSKLLLYLNLIWSTYALSLAINIKIKLFPKNSGENFAKERVVFPACRLFSPPHIAIQGNVEHVRVIITTKDKQTYMHEKQHVLWHFTMDLEHSTLKQLLLSLKDSCT
jgi:hypothetical protein